MRIEWMIFKKINITDINIFCDITRDAHQPEPEIYSISLWGTYFMGYKGVRAGYGKFLMLKFSMYKGTITVLRLLVSHKVNNKQIWYSGLQFLHILTNLHFLN